MSTVISAKNPKIFRINCCHCKSTLECNRWEMRRTIGFNSKEFFICIICGEENFSFEETTAIKKDGPFANKYYNKAAEFINNLPLPIQITSKEEE